MSVRRSVQMTAQDTLRWGGRQNFRLIAGTKDGFSAVSKQLILARWRWPLTWKTCLIVVTQLGASETGTFDVDFQWNVGVGDNVTSFSLGKLAAIAASGTSVQFFDMPAQEFNIIATITAHNLATTTEDNFVVGALAAPWTEPHAMTHMLDHFAAGEGERQDGWMPPGFEPEELGYHR